MRQDIDLKQLVEQDNPPIAYYMGESGLKGHHVFLLLYSEVTPNGKVYNILKPIQRITGLGLFEILFGWAKTNLSEGFLELLSESPDQMIWFKSGKKNVRETVLLLPQNPTNYAHELNTAQGGFFWSAAQESFNKGLKVAEYIRKKRMSDDQIMNLLTSDRLRERLGKQEFTYLNELFKLNNTNASITNKKKGDESGK